MCMAGSMTVGSHIRSHCTGKKQVSHSWQPPLLAGLSATSCPMYPVAGRPQLLGAPRTMTAGQSQQHSVAARTQHPQLPGATGAKSPAHFCKQGPAADGTLCLICAVCVHLGHCQGLESHSWKGFLVSAAARAKSPISFRSLRPGCEWRAAGTENPTAYFGPSCISVAGRSQQLWPPSCRGLPTKLKLTEAG